MNYEEEEEEEDNRKENKMSKNWRKANISLRVETSSSSFIIELTTNIYI